MERHQLNRRKWLKSGLLATAGLGLLPSWVRAKASGITVGSPDVRQALPHTDSAGMADLAARLSANENPYGPPPVVRQAITDAISLGNRYGHGDAAVLIDLIARKEGVTADHIMLGPGSTDLLEKTAITLFLKGGNVVSADPSYMSLMNTARAIGASWKPVPLTADFAHDLSGMEAAVDAQTRLVYVCNPNNPTGSITAAGPLAAFCARVSQRVPVFIDEAYLDFLDDYAGNTMVGLVAEGHDVIVARTFSKIYGMAGLRIGYIVAKPERIARLTGMVRGTMGLCVTSIQAAIASLKGGGAFCGECRELNAAARDYTVREVTALGYRIIPSYTNFLLFPMGEQLAGDDFLAKMRAEGVGVRVFTIQQKQWCRVSIGKMHEMELFVSAFKRVMA